MKDNEDVEIITWAIVQLARPSQKTGDPGGFGSLGLAALAFDEESDNNIVQDTVPVDYQDHHKTLVELIAALALAYRQRAAH